MKIVMLSYHNDGKTIDHKPGDIAEFDDVEATRLIEVGGARALTEADRYVEAKRNSIEQLQAMTVAELTTIAENHQVDLAGASKKADILAAIIASLERAELADKAAR